MARVVSVRVARFGIGCLLGASLSWLGSACSGAHEPTQRPPEVPRRMVEVKPTANVTELLNYTIDKLRQRLGPAHNLPSSLADSIGLKALAPHATDSLLTFETGGLVLLASYDVRSRRLNDLFVLGQHEDSLMQRATLRVGAPNYMLLPCFQSAHPGRLLGLRVVPVRP